MRTTKKRRFKIYLPPTEDREARHVDTIDVDVYEEFGEEFLTEESSERIETARAYHMGLLSAKDIRSLRRSLNLTQLQLAELIQCGKKSLSRWENGRGYPSGLVNTLLRLLESGRVKVDDLREMRGPRQKKILWGTFDSKAPDLSSELEDEAQELQWAS